MSGRKARDAPNAWGWSADARGSRAKQWGTMAQQPKRRSVGRRAGSLGLKTLSLTVRLVLTIILGWVGIGALILAIVVYGDWRSSQSTLGLLTNTTPPVEYVSAMVLLALVAIACLSVSYLIWVSRPRRARGHPAPAHRAPDRLDQLSRLSELHRGGALTDAEFEAEKRKLLAQ